MKYDLETFFLQLFTHGFVYHISWRQAYNFIAFINILWVSTVFSTPYLFLDTAARLQWPVTHFSTYDITYKKAKTNQKKNKKIRDTQMKYDLETFFLQLTIYLMISQPPDYSDPWPTLARSTSFFLIMLFNDHQLHEGMFSIIFYLYLFVFL
jgi:uncharacterized membrane protein